MKNIPKEVQYDIWISNGANINKIVTGETNIISMEADITNEIAYLMIYKQSTKFKTFDEYKKSEDPWIDLTITIKIDNDEKKYTINENVLMYIYNCKFDEYYVESEYEISDWAISSTSSSSSSTSSSINDE